MINLEIENFSCFKKAHFELAPVTILIGPQGSGKSVTIKLNYFFCDIMKKQQDFAERGLSLEEVKKELARQFCLWFPPSAWGKGRFIINFYAGEFSARILRRLNRGNVANEVTFSFSDFFNTQYSELLAAYQDYRSKDIEGDAASFRRSFEGLQKIREAAERKLVARLGDSYINTQMFVPAGRAFFTSIGRLVAGIDQGSSLDPITINFAKLFAALRDRLARFSSARNMHGEESKTGRLVMQKLFGGEIKFENELEFVETTDGRKVPFSALSSGQQELLPMWILIDYFSERFWSRSGGSEIFYIEEPEAHLFPEAQSTLMDFLIGTIASTKEKRNLVLTTHSPYILGKLNNYLKAGAIGKTRRHTQTVGNLVPKECWLTPDRVKAIAIEDGTLWNILGNDGLINGTYIDHVSEDVSRTFSSLLDIQYPEVAK